MDQEALRRALRGRRPGLQQARSEYAVLAPLLRRPEGLCLLYELRPTQLRHHSGEVCFPGGRVEPGETLAHCALRETQEELGIPPERVELLGELDFLYLRSEALMHPFLGLLDPAAELRPNPAEVRETFCVPLDWLRAHPPVIYRYPLLPQIGEDFPYEQVGASEAYRWRPGQMEVPVYEGLPHPLWGLTARITWWLLEQWGPLLEGI